MEWFILVAIGIGGLLLGALLVWLLLRQAGTMSPGNGQDQAMHLLQQQVGNLAETMDKRLDSTQTEARQSVERQLQASSKLVADVSSRMTKLDETNKQVMGVTDELKLLQNTLQNPKQRGVLGEYHLQSVLENVLPPGQFELQYSFADGTKVDAVVRLDKAKILPVDSKYSLENYNRYISAKTPEDKKRLAAKVREDLKRRIDETSKYIKPDEDTMDFAFMFIPSEAIYYDLLVHRVGSSAGGRDLIEYAFRERQVIIVSPTSFMAYLQTVMHGLRSLKIEEQAKDIQVRVGQLARHLQVHDELMAKLGKSMQVSTNHFNNAHKELRKIDGDAAKIHGGKTKVREIEIEAPRLDA